MIYKYNLFTVCSVNDKMVKNRINEKFMKTSYYYSGDGVLEAYVRIGNESVKATSTELKRLVLRGSNTSYDSRISNYSYIIDR